MVIAVLGVVFFLAWYITRFIALRSKGKTAGRFMRVVDRLSLSGDKAILLVKIGSEYCVVGVTGHEMSLIGKLDGEQAAAFEEEATASSSGEMWKGFQSVGARLAMALRRRAAPPQSGAAPREQHRQAERSVLDMMDERIKLRKETKRW
jgi:flagellar biosynthetic protein FliO